MSIQAIREAFELAARPADPTQAHKALRCIAARMSYCDQDGIIGGAKRDHQLLEFDVVRGSDNMTKTIRSAPIHCGEMLTYHAAQLAKQHSQD